MTERTRVIVLRLLLACVLVLSWEVMTGGLGFGWQAVDQSLIARPSLIAKDAIDYASSGLLARDVRITLTEAFLGLLLGAIAGVTVGLLLGHAKRTAAVLEPFMTALNSLPRITLAPVFVVWLGIGIGSKVALSMVTVFFVIFFNTYLGVQSVDPELIRVVKVMGGSGAQVTRLVVIPSVASWVFAALRTSVSFALTGAVVGEFVGSSAGLGYRMLMAVGMLHTERVFTIMILLMVIGVAVVEASKRAEQYLLRWRPPLNRAG